jgi:hypothetical protein
MPMPTTPIDPGRCPLCGHGNSCAMELERCTGLPQPACWCTAQAIAPETLAQLPPEAVNRACLCPGCAAGHAP